MQPVLSQLAEFFANLGPVRKSIVIKDKGKCNPFVTPIDLASLAVSHGCGGGWLFSFSTGKTTSRGFGFVQLYVIFWWHAYHSTLRGSLTPSNLRSALEEDASRAVAETHGKRWKGRALSVELANERKHFKLRAGADNVLAISCDIGLTSVVAHQALQNMSRTKSQSTTLPTVMVMVAGRLLPKGESVEPHPVWMTSLESVFAVQTMRAFLRGASTLRALSR